jgi:WD40 repeat protein
MEIAFAKDGSRLFTRYRYSHWHDGSGRIANPPADLVLRHEQYNAQWYTHIKSLEPPTWKPQGLTDQAPAVAVLPKSEQTPPPPPVSADGRLRAATTPNGDIELWDAGTNRLRATLEGHGYPIRALRFSPDGRALASLDEAHVVKVWDFAPPPLYGQWQGTAAAFSPDETTLAVGGHRVDRSPMIPDTTVQFVDLRTGRSGGQFELWDAPSAMAYSADGEVLAVGETLYSRDGAGWKEVKFDGPCLVLPGAKRVFLPEAKVLAVFQDKSEVGLDAATPEQANVEHRGPEPHAAALVSGVVERKDHDVHDMRIGYRPSDKTVVVTQRKWFGASLTVSHFDPATGKRTECRSVPLRASVNWLAAVTPGGESVVASDRTTGEFLKHTATLQVIDLTSGIGIPLPGTHSGGCVGVGVSPDGRWLASGDSLGVVRVWDLRTRKRVKEFWARGNGIERLVVSPTGRYLAVAGTDKVVRVWVVSALGIGE